MSSTLRAIAWGLLLGRNPNAADSGDSPSITRMVPCSTRAIHSGVDRAVSRGVVSRDVVSRDGFPRTSLSRVFASLLSREFAFDLAPFNAVSFNVVSFDSVSRDLAPFDRTPFGLALDLMSLDSVSFDWGARGRASRGFVSLDLSPFDLISPVTITTAASAAEPLTNPIDDSTAGHDPASFPITAYENDPPDATEQNKHAAKQTF